MTKYSSTDVDFFLLGKYSLLGDVTELSEAHSGEVKDATVLGDAWRKFGSVGIKQGELTQNGFFNDDTDRIHDALKGGYAGERVGAAALSGGAIGDKVLCFEGLIQVGYERTTALAEWIGASGKYQVTGHVEDAARLLHDLSEETADGNTEASSVDSAASSSDGGAGYVFVTDLALDTATNFAPKVIHSADGAAWVDLVAFDTLTVAGAERKEATGTVNRYLASEWAFTGGAGASSAVTFAILFHRN